MENTFNLKKYLAEGKLTENITDLVVTYYKDKDTYDEKGLADGFHTEDGKKVKYIVGYDDNDDITDIGYIYSQSGADIETDYTEDDLDDAFMNSLNEVKKVVNEDEMGMDFSAGNTILAVINHLIDNDRQDVLDVLQGIPQWNELVDQAVDM